VGAIVLSLAIAPPLADQNLQIASRNTAAASSFEVRYSLAASSPTSSGRTSPAVRVAYRAPDEMIVHQPATTGGTVTTLLIGGDVWASSDGGHQWQKINTGQFGAATLTAVRNERNLFVRPLLCLTTATGVTQRGAVYVFTPTDRCFAKAIGVPANQLAAARVVVRATIEGEFLHVLNVTVHLPTGNVTLSQVFSHVDQVPPITPPPPSSVTSSPALGGLGGG
jgi:hypothetical protein